MELGSDRTHKALSNAKPKACGTHKKCIKQDQTTQRGHHLPAPAFYPKVSQTIKEPDWCAGVDREPRDSLDLQRLNTQQILAGGSGGYNQKDIPTRQIDKLESREGETPEEGIWSCHLVSLNDNPDGCCQYSRITDVETVAMPSSQDHLDSCEAKAQEENSTFKASEKEYGT
ncbi:hypothetical protein STEG23_005090 [Scotinomys teguina]